MKKVLTVMTVVLGVNVFGVNAYAAGDLSVAGKVGVGIGIDDRSKVRIFTDEVGMGEPWEGSYSVTGLRVDVGSEGGNAIRASSRAGNAIYALSNSGYATYAESSSGTAAFFGSWNAEKPVLIATGSNIGFGTYTPDANYRLHVVGDILADNFLQTSDEKYKKNIAPIESPLNKILSLKGITYEWKIKEYKDKGFSEGANYGVIAQQVEKVLPEVVKEGKTSGKAVSYNQIIPVLIEAVKAQQKTINELKARQVAMLEQQKTMTGLSEKLARLERQMQLKNSVVMADTARP